MNALAIVGTTLSKEYHKVFWSSASQQIIAHMLTTLESLVIYRPSVSSHKLVSS